MPRAVRFDRYGGIDVLRVEDVERPVPGEGQLLVKVKAAGINPGQAKVREGLMHERWPATFPSGKGSDLAGVVEELGPGSVGFAVGDGRRRGWRSVLPRPAGLGVIRRSAPGDGRLSERRAIDGVAGTPFRSRNARVYVTWWPLSRGRVTLARVGRANVTWSDGNARHVTKPAPQRAFEATWPPHPSAVHPMQPAPRGSA